MFLEKKLILKNYLNSYESNKIMIIAVTGHRPSKIGNEYNLEGSYSDYFFNQFQEIIDLYQPEIGISGMALGIDTLWAISVLSNNIKLSAAIPFEGQESMWPDKSKNVYNKILSHPLTTKYYISEPGYSAKKMQIRNQWMVDKCDILIACWDGTEGGTGNCVRYAEKVVKKIIYLDPKNALK